MNQNIIIQDIKLELLEQLKTEAQQKHVDLNTLLINILQKYLKKNKPHIEVYQELDSLAGTWSEEEYQAFTENTAPFNQIDKELWK